MTETRVVEVSAPDEDGVYHLDWTCRFKAVDRNLKLDRTPLPGEPGGQAWGGYAGLSLRMVNLEERQAVTTTGPAEFNAQDRLRIKAPAMEYNGSIDGKEVGVTICDHPDNLNAPTPWYAIRSKVMTFYSPAVLCFGPHTIEAGDTLTLRYRVIVHPDRWDAKKVRDEYETFIRPADRR